MAHESFEDEEVAQVLNRDYVSIKVDKEERPDIDSVYMAVCQGLTGSGGWPLTIIMSPDQKPFFAGTYYPRTSRYHGPGILDILDAVTKEWKNNKESLLKTGDKIVSVLDSRIQQRKQEWNRSQADGKTPRLKKDLIDEAREALYQSFDNWYGGFGSSPKFPSAHNLVFVALLQAAKRGACAGNCGKNPAADVSGRDF
jgi:uncharacterized protein YyaL (SSP411 family)